MKRNAVAPQTNLEVGQAAIAQLDTSIQEMSLARDAALTMITGQIANMTETATQMRQEAQTAAQMKAFYTEREDTLNKAAEGIEKVVEQLSALLVAADKKGK